MTLDIIVGILVAIGFYQGYSRGLVKTVFATLSLLIAIVAALKLSPLVIALLQKSFSINPAILFVLGFVLTFVAVMWFVRYIGNGLEKLLKAVHINGINKLSGALILSAFYALLISVGVLFLDKIELISENTKRKSITYPYLKPLPQAANSIGQNLKPVFSEFWNKMLYTMDSIKEEASPSEKSDEIY